jgi:hypothetical protein
MRKLGDTVFKLAGCGFVMAGHFLRLNYFAGPRFPTSARFVYADSPNKPQLPEVATSYEGVWWNNMYTDRNFIDILVWRACLT